MTHVTEIGAENRYRKTGTGFWRIWYAIWYRIFLVSVFGNEYFLSCRFMVPVFGADFWHECHGHKRREVGQ